jgi:hypothetical protein
VAYGLILHDCGWSTLSKREVAESLMSYKGLRLKGRADDLHKRGGEEGLKLSRKLLGKYKFTPGLTWDEEDLILKIVSSHSNKEKVRELPLEAGVMVDLDRLWSFTHFNFWQDTIRKDVKPQDYIKNLKRDLDDYFIFETGKKIARSLLGDRREKVGKLLRWRRDKLTKER